VLAAEGPKPERIMIDSIHLKAFRTAAAATRPVDFRKGAERLAALVRETMGCNPFDGALYVFRAKRADRIKIVFWDGTGVCLFANYLASYCISFI
jgi:transposase